MSFFKSKSNNSLTDSINSGYIKTSGNLDTLVEELELSPDDVFSDIQDKYNSLLLSGDENKKARVIDAFKSLINQEEVNNLGLPNNFFSKDPYTVLGISPESGLLEQRAAYFYLLNMYNPKNCNLELGPSGENLCSVATAVLKNSAKKINPKILTGSDYNKKLVEQIRQGFQQSLDEESKGIKILESQLSEIKDRENLYKKLEKSRRGVSGLRGRITQTDKERQEEELRAILKKIIRTRINALFKINELERRRVYNLRKIFLSREQLALVARVAEQIRNNRREKWGVDFVDSEFNDDAEQLAYEYVIGKINENVQENMTGNQKSLYKEFLKTGPGYDIADRLLEISPDAVGAKEILRRRRLDRQNAALEKLAAEIQDLPPKEQEKVFKTISPSLASRLKKKILL